MARGRVGAVPDVGDVRAAVGAAQEVAGALGVGVQRAVGHQVRVHPQADPEALLGQGAQHRGRVGERLGVPAQVRPGAGHLPVAVQVQHVAGDAPLPDPAGPLQHLLLTVGVEAGGDPGAEGPPGRQVRAAGEQVQPVQHLRRSRPGQHVVVEQVVGDQDLHRAVGGLADVELHRQSAVDQQAVAAVGQVERDVLVGPVGLAAEGVEVPHQGPLAALVQRGELLAEADEPFVAGGEEALVPGDADPVGRGAPERQGTPPAADVARARILLDEHGAVGTQEPDPPRVEGDLGDDRAGGHPYLPVVDGDRGRVGLWVHQRHGAGGAAAGLRVLGQPYPDHSLAGRVDAYHRGRAVGQRGLERRAVRVGAGDLGPAHHGRAALAGGPHGQVGRVGDEGLVRHQRRSVRHGRLLDEVFRRCRQFL